VLMVLFCLGGMFIPVRSCDVVEAPCGEGLLCINHGCVECVTKDDCDDPTKPLCFNGACVECEDNKDCKDSAKPSCNGNVCTARIACENNNYCGDRNNAYCVRLTKSSASGSSSASTGLFCAPCQHDAECSKFDDTPKCSLGKCMQCNKRTDCKGDTPGCVNHVCSQCDNDKDCAGIDGLNVCDKKVGVCVECIANKDCSGDLPKCDTDKKICGKCQIDKDCTQSSKNLKCNSESGKCAGCKSNKDCGLFPDTLACSTSKSLCVECTKDTDCKSVKAAKCNTETNLCVACDADSQCKRLGTGPAACVDGKCDICGDGHRPEGSPSCDDGNLKDGDGCDKTCKIEKHWICIGGDDSTADLCAFEIQATSIKQLANPAIFEVKFNHAVPVADNPWEEIIIITFPTKIDFDITVTQSGSNGIKIQLTNIATDIPKSSMTLSYQPMSGIHAGNGFLTPIGSLKITTKAITHSA